MNNEFELITKTIKNIKLTESEKSIMLTNISENASPSYEENQDVTNPTTSRLYYYYQNIKSNYFMINKNKFIPAFVIILIVVLTGGTSAFAEKAVPGDLLYGVKVSINEPAAGIFSSFSTEEKTEWKERLVERRLEEAQKLVSKNDFKETTRIELENQIKGQIDEFTINVNELALEKDKSTNSSDLNIRLQASLSAYKNILKKLSEDTDTNSDTKQETKKLLASLGEYKDKVNSDHNNLELNVGINSEDNSRISKNKEDKDNSKLETSTSVSTTAAISVIADSASTLAKQNAAENLLNSTKLSYQKEKINLSANVQSQVDSKLAGAETAFQEGKTLYTSSNYTEATSKFQLTINEVNGAKLLMLSNIIKGDIEDDMGIDDDDIEDDDIGFDDHGDDLDDSDEDELNDDEGEDDDESSLNLPNELELELEDDD
jgi:hypothetical protein